MGPTRISVEPEISDEKRQQNQIRYNLDVSSLVGLSNIGYAWVRFAPSPKLGLLGPPRSSKLLFVHINFYHRIDGNWDRRASWNKACMGEFRDIRIPAQVKWLLKKRRRPK
jgi:hypothetical protein